MPKLRNHGIVKIFFSSPFGGMEEEREELTRRYFPAIRHLCHVHGLQFAAVDMRWGITAESSDNFQVINICLREIDRSDMFVGFFGQRYGWHGAEDKMLQENFDNAAGRYPWLNGVRDKSVTELEFLHGFLNDPDKLPSALFFRDKAYDDTVRAEGVEKGDKKQVFKYSAESELSTSLMDDLKGRVREQRDKSLGVYMDYKTPAEAAKTMFDIIMTYLRDKLLADLDVKKPSKREEILGQHDAFLASRCNFYVHGDRYMQQLNRILDTGETKRVLVTGDAGTGKSALLCNWITSLKQQPQAEYCVFYHFTGFAENSTDVNGLLLRMVREFESRYSSLVDGSTQFDQNQEQNAGQETDEVTRALVQRVVWLVGKLGGLGKTPVIVIDGLDKVKVKGKIKKVLFWLPANFPPQCMVVVSTVTMDTARIGELESRQYQLVAIEPLATEAKHEMLVETLKESGKELSPSQVDKIVAAKMTSLPLFMKISLSELVSFGYFRLLDKKIDSLISSKSVEELFTAVLERLEDDYNVSDYDGNLVEQVMCSVCLSHQGLSEVELQEIYTIPDHVWSPLYFAIEKLTVNQAGYIQFGFTEFREAVKEKYLLQEEKKQFYLKKLIEYFEKKLTKGEDMPGLAVQDTRPVFELPWLWIELGDTAGLVRCLSHWAVFCTLEMHSIYELVEMWQRTELTGTQMATALLKTFDDKVAQLYVDLEHRGVMEDVETPGVQLEAFLKAVDHFLLESGLHEAREKVILRNIKVLTDGLKHGVRSRAEVEDRLYFCKYRLACLKCEMYKQQEEGIALHEELKQDLERENVGSQVMLSRLGFAYNGLACGYMSLAKYDKVIDYCEKSVECHTKSGDPQALSYIGASYSNIALALTQSEAMEAALPYFDKAIECYEEYHFGETPPVIGEILTNKGLCLKRLDRMEEAEQVYKKSLEVKVKALGRNHAVVAAAIMNLGSLQLFQKKYEAARDYFRQCLEIHEALEQTWTNVKYIQAWENLFGVEISLDHYEEVEEDFMKIFDWRIKDNSIGGCIVGIYRDFVRHFMRVGKFEAGYRVLSALMGCNEHREDEISYLLMDIIVSNLPPAYREKLPREFSLEYGLEKFPQSIPLARQLVEQHLVPARDEDRIAHVINDLHDNLDPTPNAFLLTLDWCQADGQPVHSCRQRIAEEGLIKYPDDLDLQLELAKSHRQQDQPGLALTHAQFVADHNLHGNPTLVFFTAQTAALACEFDVCRKYSQHLLDTCEDAAVIDQVTKLLKLINDHQSTLPNDAQKVEEDPTGQKT